MTGILNFFREDWVVEPQVVGKLFYFGGEPIDTSDEGNDLQGLENHFLKCSNPDQSPQSCHECSQSASFSDGSFVNHDGDDVYSIQEVLDAIERYYNGIAVIRSETQDSIKRYRPYHWIEGSNEKSFNKYKNVKLLMDKDGDVWYALAELQQPLNISSTYIDKLQKHFEDD